MGWKFAGREVAGACGMGRRWKRVWDGSVGDEKGGWVDLYGDAFGAWQCC